MYTCEISNFAYIKYIIKYVMNLKWENSSLKAFKTELKRKFNKFDNFII